MNYDVTEEEVVAAKQAYEDYLNEQLPYAESSTEEKFSFYKAHQRALEAAAKVRGEYDIRRDGMMKRKVPEAPRDGTRQK